MTAPDPVAAYLTEAQARFSNTNYAITTESPRMLSVAVASTSDVPRLIAAVEVALGFHQPNDSMVPVCKGCELTWPCYGHAAISAALLGKEDCDGG